jgi:signal transduction histidine kinase
LPDNKDEKIDARLSEFLQELRHEVYTPLSVIKGYTELIGEKLVDTKDPEIKKYLHVIMKNIDRLEAFTEKLLTIETLMESLKEEG